MLLPVKALGVNLFGSTVASCNTTRRHFTHFTQPGSRINSVAAILKVQKSPTNQKSRFVLHNLLYTRSFTLWSVLTCSRKKTFATPSSLTSSFREPKFTHFTLYTPSSKQALRCNLFSWIRIISIRCDYGTLGFYKMIAMNNAKYNSFVLLEGDSPKSFMRV